MSKQAISSGRARTRPPIRSGEPATGGPVSIRTLVVDDEWAIRALLREVLEREGHDVVEAENGVEAERVIDLRPFNLVVTDLVMPERDGLETLRHMRAHHPRVPVVVAGTAANDILLQCARVMGAAGFLLKPFRYEDVIQTLEEIGPLPGNGDLAVARAVADPLERTDRDRRA